MSEGDWIIGRIRAALPEALQPLWQFGLAIMFFVGAFLTVALDQVGTLDYVRNFAFAEGAYIVLIAGRIAWVNQKVRRELAAMDRNTAHASLLPTHIVLIAIATILHVALTCAVMIQFYGEDSSILGGTFAWWASFIFFVKVVSLNVVWRFVLTKRDS